VPAGQRSDQDDDPFRDVHWRVVAESAPGGQSPAVALMPPETGHPDGSSEGQRCAAVPAVGACLAVLGHRRQGASCRSRAGVWGVKLLHGRPVARASVLPHPAALLSAYTKRAQPRPASTAYGASGRTSPRCPAYATRSPRSPCPTSSTTHEEGLHHEANLKLHRRPRHPSPAHPARPDGPRNQPLMDDVLPRI
jgi:hypothetical protein